MTTSDEDACASGDAPLTKWNDRGVGCVLMVLVVGFPAAGALFSTSVTMRWYWAAITAATLLWPLWEGMRARRGAPRPQGRAPGEIEHPRSGGASQ